MRGTSNADLKIQRMPRDPLGLIFAFQIPGPMILQMWARAPLPEVIQSHQNALSVVSIACAPMKSVSLKVIVARAAAVTRYKFLQRPENPLLLLRFCLTRS